MCVPCRNSSSTRIRTPAHPHTFTHAPTHPPTSMIDRAVFSCLTDMLYGDGIPVGYILVNYMVDYLGACAGCGHRQRQDHLWCNAWAGNSDAAGCRPFHAVCIVANHSVCPCSYRRRALLTVSWADDRLWTPFLTDISHQACC